MWRGGIGAGVSGAFEEHHHVLRAQGTLAFFCETNGTRWGFIRQSERITHLHLPYMPHVLFEAQGGITGYDGAGGYPARVMFDPGDTGRRQ